MLLAIYLQNKEFVSFRLLHPSNSLMVLCSCIDYALPLDNFSVCHRTVFNNFTSYFMPNDTRTSKWKFSFYNMEIRVANSTSCTEEAQYQKQFQNIKLP